MAGKIKVLNIGVFKPINTWFLNDMKSFNHYFNLLPNTEVVTDYFLYDDIKRGEIGEVELAESKKMAKSFLELIKEFERKNVNEEDIDLVIILIHGHGSTEDKQWELMLKKSSIRSVDIFNSFKGLTEKFRTLVVLNSCNAEQEDQNESFPLTPIDGAVFSNKFSFLNKGILQGYPSFFGELEIRDVDSELNISKHKSEESIEVYSMNIDNKRIKKPLLKFNLANNVTIYEKEITFQLYFVSLSRNSVDRANSYLSCGGILINSLALIDDKMKIGELWHFIKTFLENLNPHYIPILSVHSKFVSKAIIEFKEMILDLGFSYKSKNNYLINQDFFDKQLPKNK
ncbi:MAG: hypothetical protein KA198_05500 [Chitinophagaceae bacterium]|nr:hypothetical protein [Chitinophagaceae bacterium]